MKVLLASPVYRSLSPETATSLTRTCLVLERHGVLIRPDQPCFILPRDPNPVRARNLIFHEFLLSGADKLVSFDADSIWEPTQILRLLQHEEDVIAPVIARKPMFPATGEIPTTSHVGYPLKPEEMKGALLKMRRIGFGMFVVTRDAIRKMENSLLATEMWFHTRPGELYEGDKIARFVDSITDENHYFLSVDDVFSERARKVGLDLWVDTEVFVGHLGSHIYA